MTNNYNPVGTNEISYYFTYPNQLTTNLWTCPKCLGSYFTNKVDADKHIQLYHTDKSVKCDKCNTQINNDLQICFKCHIDDQNNKFNTFIGEMKKLENKMFDLENKLTKLETHLENAHQKLNSLNVNLSSKNNTIVGIENFL